MKVLAGRPQDLDDTVAVLRAQGDGLDAALARATLLKLERVLEVPCPRFLYAQAPRRQDPDVQGGSSPPASSTGPSPTPTAAPHWPRRSRTRSRRPPPMYRGTLHDQRGEYARAIADYERARRVAEEGFALAEWIGVGPRPSGAGAPRTRLIPRPLTRD
jgi:hypothetical protein